MITHSESIVKITGALIKAQKNISSAIKDSENPHFKSKYADISSIIEACKEALNAEGIAVTQPLHSNDQGYFLTTDLRHESGEFLSSSFKLLLGKQDMQGLLAASTYGRRGALQSFLLIATEDDDGETAVGRGKAHDAPKGNQQKVAIKPIGVKNDGIGIFCERCENELVLHPSKAGYICPMAGPEGDGHLRVLMEHLDIARADQQRQRGA